MLDNLPVGSYIPRESVIHRLRARTKLLLLCWLAVSFFIANHKQFHYGVYGLAFALLILTLLLSGANPGYIWRRMRLLFLLMALSAPFILIWTTGPTWRTFGPLTFSLAGVQIPIEVVVTYDGLWFTVSTTCIFLLLYLGTLALSLSTTPVALAEAIVLLLRPFRRMGLPADEFGLMTLLSLRFVPTLVQETNQLIKAQVSRGADFTTGSVSARVRGVVTLVVPLTEGALRRAGGLATALEARGYGVTGEATPLHEGRMRPLDWALLGAIPLLTALVYVFL
ncbi:MAG TPA: energy-coupling factor transporter transmembrane component T [Ktedonobacterales bacterium]|jgi:energy-coupling factor transport system permease protein|nr:energy-coupling factor transporter transmembrane component T [Ktedonobacterales bacterium]